MLEATGFSTLMVTMMPFWAEKLGVPRTLAVEFPFGHTLGQSNHVDQQRRVIRQALNVFEDADTPGAIVHSPEVWLELLDEAKTNWQPKEPSPIVEVMTPQVLKFLRQKRGAKS